MYEYTTLVAGATLHAAQCLIDGTADVAINWFGGWHHGTKYVLKDQHLLYFVYFHNYLVDII